MESASRPNAGARSRSCGIVAEAGRSGASGIVAGLVVLYSEAARSTVLTAHRAKSEQIETGCNISEGPPELSEPVIVTRLCFPLVFHYLMAALSQS
jgi:hypothetical protein